MTNVPSPCWHSKKNGWWRDLPVSQPNPHITVKFHSLYTQQTTRGIFFHCSSVHTPNARIRSHVASPCCFSIAIYSSVLRTCGEVTGTPKLRTRSTSCNCELFFNNEIRCAYIYIYIIYVYACYKNVLWLYICVKIISIYHCIVHYINTWIPAESSWFNIILGRSWKLFQEGGHISVLPSSENYTLAWRWLNNRQQKIQ